MLNEYFEKQKHGKWNNLVKKTERDKDRFIFNAEKT